MGKNHANFCKSQMLRAFASAFISPDPVPKYCGTQVPQESPEGNLSRNPRPSLFTSLENHLGEHILAAND